MFLGRRQHVSHAFYLDKDGHKHIRMKFHLKGTAHTGTAHLDMVEVNFKFIIICSLFFEFLFLRMILESMSTVSFLLKWMTYSKL